MWENAPRVQPFLRNSKVNVGTNPELADGSLNRNEENAEQMQRRSPGYENAARIGPALVFPRILLCLFRETGVND
jgi:hypothetical protein